MRVVLAGAHGQIALRLARRLGQAGDEVLGLIRNPDHASDVEDQGARAVLCDLERATVEEIAAAIEAADAAVFAAGAGPGSGAARKLSMDRDGAIKLLRASEEAGVDRFLILSAVGAEDPPDGDDDFSVYLRAKAEADQVVRGSATSWTILRPGRLTDDPGRGSVRLDENPFRGEIPRDDVAALLARLLREPGSVRKVLYVNSGPDALEAALAALRHG